MKVFFGCIMIVLLAVACGGNAERSVDSATGDTDRTIPDSELVLTPCSSQTAETMDSLLARLLDIDIRKITRRADLQKDLGADELDIVEFAMELEKKFQITLPDEQVEKFKTMDDFYKITFDKVCKDK